MKKIMSVLLAPYSFYKKVQKKMFLYFYKMNGAEIGKNTYLGPNVYIDVKHKPGKIVIGENCYITRNTILLAHTDTKMGGPIGIWEKYGGKRVYGTTEIGNNVFIGVNSVILPGVKIGNNAIIGAQSLVKDDVPEGKIAVGNPAKIIGSTAKHLGIDKL